MIIPPNLAAYFRPDTPLPGVPLDPALAPGYRACTDAEYRAFPGLNASLLKNPTPCEMLADMQPGESSESEALAFGTLVHWAALEPWRLTEPEKHTVLCPTKTFATKAAEEVREANPGKLMVTPEMMQNAHACLSAIRLNPQAVELLSQPGHTEAAAFVFCHQFKVWRKAKFDYLPIAGDYFLDIKTTRKELFRFEKECWDLGYFLQAAWYLAVHYLLTGQRRKWYWLAITKSEPFMTRVIELQCPLPGSALYENSKLAHARQRLGLDDSEMLGRVPAWISAAQETLSLAERNETLTPAAMRQTWPGYEQETPIFTLL